MKLNDAITLPAGHKLGMGTLKHPVTGRIVRVETNDVGKPFYTVAFRTAKDKRDRFTYISEDQS